MSSTPMQIVNNTHFNHILVEGELGVIYFLFALVYLTFILLYINY